MKESLDTIMNAIPLWGRYCLKGALYGCVFPATLYAMYQLALCGIQICGIVVLPMVLMEAPVALIGKVFQLPVMPECLPWFGYNMNTLGHTLVFILWTTVGAWCGGALYLFSHLSRRLPGQK
jgi:hypothetical protein